MAFMGLIKRELVSRLRLVKTLVCLFLLIGPIILFAVNMWPDTGQIQWFQVGMTSKGYVVMVTSVLFAGAALFMPGIAATTLVLERETNSWDMLSLTLIGSWGIVLGKLCGAMGVYLLFVVGVAPLLCAVFFMVGIDIYQLAISFYLVILTTLTCASLGMMTSAYSRTTTRAISRSYVLMALNMGLGFLLVLLVYWVYFLFTEGPNSNSFGNQTFWQTPAYSTFAMMYASGIRMYSPTAMTDQYLVQHTVMQVIVIVASLTLTWGKVRKAVNPPVAKKRAPRAQLAGTAGGALPLPRGFKAIPERMNPVFFRELRFGIDIRTRVFVGFILLMVVLSGILAYTHFETDMGIPTILVTIYFVDLALVSMFALSNLAGIFTKEDELKNIDMLRMTMLTSRQVVNGKIRAGMRVVNRIILASVCINAIFLVPGLFKHNIYNGGHAPNWTYWVSVTMFFRIHFSLWLCGLLCVVIACFASVVCTKTRTSVVVGYMIAGMMYFGNMWLVAMTGALQIGGGAELFYFLTPASTPFISEIFEFRGDVVAVSAVHTSLYLGLALLLYFLIGARYRSFDTAGEMD